MKQPIHLSKSEIDTRLNCAIAEDNLNYVQWMVEEHCADVTAKTDTSPSWMFHAIQSKEILSYLYHSGAPLSPKDAQGCNVLLFGIQSFAPIENIEQLLKWPIDCTIFDKGNNILEEPMNAIMLMITYYAAYNTKKRDIPILLWIMNTLLQKGCTFPDDNSWMQKINISDEQQSYWIKFKNTHLAKKEAEQLLSGRPLKPIYTKTRL